MGDLEKREGRTGSGKRAPKAGQAQSASSQQSILSRPRPVELGWSLLDEGIDDDKDRIGPGRVGRLLMQTRRADGLVKDAESGGGSTAGGRGAQPKAKEGELPQEIR